MADGQHYLKEFLNAFWLRPETAAWRTCDCLALDGIPFTPPVADIGCGDGLFSFIRAGGRIDPRYDMFRQAGSLDGFFAKVDIYDHYDRRNLLPEVVEKPAYSVAVGIDHKQALLDKAAMLSFYHDLRLADANRALPLEDGTYRTIFSNILYWLDDYPATLKEIRRALADDGRVILHVPSETFRDYSFYQRLSVRGGDERWQWLHLIDRGRSDNIRQCKDFESWRAEFAAAGLAVVHHRQYLSKMLVEAWDIGLRPISPFLIEMANDLADGKRLDVKRRWIEALVPLISPFCALETPDDDAHPPGFHLFVLEKAR